MILPGNSIGAWIDDLHYTYELHRLRSLEIADDKIVILMSIDMYRHLALTGKIDFYFDGRVTYMGYEVALIEDDGFEGFLQPMLICDMPDEIRPLSDGDMFIGRWGEDSPRGYIYRKQYFPESCSVDGYNLGVRVFVGGFPTQNELNKMTFDVEEHKGIDNPLQTQLDETEIDEFLGSFARKKS